MRWMRFEGRISSDEKMETSFSSSGAQACQPRGEGRREYLECCKRGRLKLGTSWFATVSAVDKSEKKQVDVERLGVVVDGCVDRVLVSEKESCNETDLST